jgi:2-deoxy-D-gluconate 3-dehydrogenase
MSFISQFELSGRIAVVTGGSTGIGAAISTGLAEAGADVVLVDHHERKETAKHIQSIGRNVLTIVADLSKQSAAHEVIDRSIAKFGKVDILVNNAGIIRRMPAIDFSEKDWNDVIDLNAKSVFFLCQAAARDMLKRKKGKIINIASLLSFQGGVTVPSYTASKGAVAQITKALANEWAKEGINVNAIAPGYMETSNTEQLRQNPERVRQITERIPAGRWGKPDDLKGAAVFLASAASDYVNGHVLVVDGGWMAR